MATLTLRRYSTQTGIEKYCTVLYKSSGKGVGDRRRTKTETEVGKRTGAEKGTGTGSRAGTET